MSASLPSPLPLLDADLDRRFGGLRRLYGPAGYARLRAAKVAVVGLGGVGSWAVEALARSGIAELVLIDFDHVSESNINRQVQATGETVGMAKSTALAWRVAAIHPGCRVHEVDAFADADNWPGLLPVEVDAVIDACDQGRAKLALAAWTLAHPMPYVCCGAAGGKQRAERIEVDDLAAVTHDPLLASLRQRLRSAHGAPRAGRLGVRCVFSREPVAPPHAEVDIACDPGTAADRDAAADRDEAADRAGTAHGETTLARGDGSLNCHGYGSTVTVTATFGLAAAGEAIAQLIA
ncbi:MAG TPA: tRNA threonylcarbamoyladenosine dehydratase [Burkholderiaceae bacterium]|nr:tRNA threonylcarbamoyladenosine dehydratase [Burkholderiaceae bacterium]